MIRTNSIVLSLCLGLLMPQLASAQAAPAAPAADDPLADVAEEGAAEEKPAAAEEQAKPAMATIPAAAIESDDDAQAHEQGAADAALQAKADKKAAAATGEKKQANKERCSQLMAQGQSALAQAEGCGGGDQPIWAGSIVSFTQTTAPAYRTLPDNNNGFYGLNLYLAPRITLTDKWALNADMTLGYEATKPDTLDKPNTIQRTDVRLLATGNLGSLGGFTFTGGPRISLPTSQASRTAEVYGGAGAGLNIIRNFEVLQGLAFIAGGSYVHTFSGRLTPKITDKDAPTCSAGSGGVNASTECAAGNTRVVADSLRAVAATSLNFTASTNMQLSYLYGWNFVKPFAKGSDQVSVANGTVTADGNVIPDTRVRRLGSLNLSLSYQPLPWFIASLQGSTTVCYNASSGGQSAFGGCSGGLNASSQWLRNPVINKFSTVGLQLTIPVDALYEAIKSGRSESKTARRKGSRQL